MLDLDITISVGDKQVSVKDLLEIDQEDLMNEFATQAARYAHFSVLTAIAERDWKRVEDSRKRMDADAFLDCKNDEDLIPKGSRTVSDEVAKSYVALDDNCVKSKVIENDMRHRYQLMRAIATAFYQRANMLQSMGASLRHEADMTGMQVSEPSRDARRAVAKRKH